MSLSRRAALGVFAAAITSLSGCARSSAGPGVVSPAPADTVSPTGPLLPVEHWRSLAEHAWPTLRAQVLPLSRSLDSHDFYRLAYTLDGLASLLEATSDPVYATRTFELISAMIASATPVLPSSPFRDGYRGWVSMAYGNREVPLYESYAWRYVARLLRVLQPMLPTASDQVHQSYAETLAFTETNIVDKWISRGVNAFVYRSRTHMAAHWASICLDVSRLTTDAGRRARCVQVVDNIDNHLPNYPSSLRQQLHPSRTESGAYWWSDVWGHSTGPGQDIGHGNGVIAYVVESNDLRAGWSDQDLDRFCRTLVRFVIRASAPYPGFVDGTGHGNGWVADGFVKLGRHDLAVQQRLQRHGVQNFQFHAAMAVNAAHLALGGHRR
jgi:hypothetical protein